MTTETDELEALIAAIRAAWKGSQTPPEFREACTAFVTERKDLLDELRAITLVTFGVWLNTTAEETGTPRNVLEQIVAVETYKCVAMMMREVREREGGKLIPARRDRRLHDERERRECGAVPLRSAGRDGYVAVRRCHRSDGGGAMTTARPILFSAPMVRALLEGRKTQTRRLAKFVARDGANLKFSGIAADQLTPSTWALVSRGAGGCWNERTQPWKCPYGVPGDLLWVRESWHLVHVGGGRGGGIDPFNSYDQTYMADGHREHFSFEGEDDPFLRFASDRPRPSMFMPRWASRLTLEVTDVKVERLQNLSEEDALAEGVTQIREACHVIKGFDYDLSGLCHSRAVIPYAKLWDHLNGPGAWDANPWVVALTFTVHKQNVDAVLSARAAKLEPAA